MPQNVYSAYHLAAFPGGLTSGHKDVRTGRNNTVTEIPFGRMCVRDPSGASDYACKLPDGASNVMMGVVMLDQAAEVQNLGYVQNSLLSLLYQGEVFVEVETAVTADTPVFVRFNAAGATGTAPAVGKFRGDADTGKATALTNCQFKSAAPAGGIALLLLNIP